MARKIKIKTPLEIVQGIRKPCAPPSKRHKDRKKELDKRRCRGKVQED